MWEPGARCSRYSWSIFHPELVVAAQRHPRARAALEAALATARATVVTLEAALAVETGCGIDDEVLDLAALQERYHLGRSAVRQAIERGELSASREDLGPAPRRRGLALGSAGGRFAAHEADRFRRSCRMGTGSGAGAPARGRKRIWPPAGTPFRCSGEIAVSA
jgi:hypothetical protein